MLLMLKGSKVVFVAHVHNIDTLNTMLKGFKRLCYVETRDKHIFAHNFLNIQLIFNPQKVLKM